jgi:flagellar basal-body rod protein FlgF
MFRGLYSAATALDASEWQQDVNASNMAFATMPGYRQKGVVFETFDRVLGRTGGDITGTSIAATYTDFRSGALQQTNHPLDLAIEGDGFFVLMGPRGPLYTRNGAFRLDAQRQIVSESGYPLRTANGPIQVPANSAQVQIAVDGTVMVDGNPLGRLDRMRFTNPSLLESVGPTLYRAAPGAGTQPATGRVMQGYRETSNVDPSQAVVTMMLGLRYFEAAQRALRAIAETVQQNTKPQ